MGRKAGADAEPAEELPKDPGLCQKPGKAGELCRGADDLRNVPDTLSQLIRTAFIPSEGNKFVVADFSAIEARVIAWLAGEQWVNEVFATHGKIYEATASQMFHVPIERIVKGTRSMRSGRKGRWQPSLWDTRAGPMPS